MNKYISKMIMVAILIEGIVTYFNEFFISGNIPWQMICSLILGIITSVSYKLDLPKHLGLKSTIPYIGSILTGILISRGSNYLYDLINKLTKLWKINFSLFRSFQVDSIQEYLQCYILIHNRFEQVWINPIFELFDYNNYLVEFFAFQLYSWVCFYLCLLF